MDVSIIIVNYNTKDLLENCIKSINERTYNLDFEIIIVDNASIDGSQDYVKQNYPKVVLIESDENLGFGKANNLGAKYAKGEFLFLLNSDTILLNNAVKILYDYMVDNPKVGISGGNLYDANERPTISFSQLMPNVCNDIDSFFGGIYSKIIYNENLFFNHTNKAMNIDGYISGADMMIKNSVLDKAGLFDCDFFMYYEETELTWRIKKLGYKIVSVPDARIIHLEGGSEIIKENTMRRMIKSKFLYFEKTNQGLNIQFSYFVFLLTAWTRIVFFYVQRDNKKMDYWTSCLDLNKFEYNLFRRSKK